MKNGLSFSVFIEEIHQILVSFSVIPVNPQMVPNCTDKNCLAKEADLTVLFYVAH